MGRPSLATQRRQEIIAATISCMASNGFAGTTLDRIAETAGMARGHIRHFAGNREEILLEAARAYYFAGTDQESLFPPGIDTLDGAVDFLFGALAADRSGNVAALPFIEAARTVPGIRDIILTAYDGTRDRIAVLLAEDLPHLALEECEEIAHGILAAAIGHIFLNDIALQPDRTGFARHTVDALLSGLSQRKDT